MTVQYTDNRVAVGVFSAKAAATASLYVRRERFVDTWILKNGNWVCVATTHADSALSSAANGTADRARHARHARRVGTCRVICV